MTIKKMSDKSNTDSNVAVTSASSKMAQIARALQSARMWAVNSTKMAVVSVVCLLLYEGIAPFDMKASTISGRGIANFNHIYLSGIYATEAEREAYIKKEVEEIHLMYQAKLKELENILQIHIIEAQRRNDIAKESFKALAQRANKLFEAVISLEKTLFDAQMTFAQRSSWGVVISSIGSDLLCGFIGQGCGAGKRMRQEMYREYRDLSQSVRTSRFEKALASADIVKFEATQNTLIDLKHKIAELPTILSDAKLISHKMIKQRRKTVYPAYHDERTTTNNGPYNQEPKDKDATSRDKTDDRSVKSQKQSVAPITLRDQLHRRLVFHHLESQKNFSIEFYKALVKVTYTSGTDRSYGYRFIGDNTMCLLNPDAKPSNKYLGCKILAPYGKGKMGWFSADENTLKPLKATATLVRSEKISD